MPLIFYTTVLIVLKHAILSNTTQNVLQIDKTEDQKFYRLRYIKLHLYSDHCMRMPIRQFEDHVHGQAIYMIYDWHLAFEQDAIAPCFEQWFRTKLKPRWMDFVF